MKAVPFEGHNTILAKDQPQYQQLPVLHEKDREGQPMTACFQLEQHEIDQLNKTGLLWSTQWTFGQPFQPISMSTACPFEHQPAILPRSINVLNDIDRTTPEGRLLFAALTILTTTAYTDKTPDETIAAINDHATEMEK